MWGVFIQRFFVAEIAQRCWNCWKSATSATKIRCLATALLNLLQPIVHGNDGINEWCDSKALVASSKLHLQRWKSPWSTSWKSITIERLIAVNLLTLAFCHFECWWNNLLISTQKHKMVGVFLKYFVIQHCFLSVVEFYTINVLDLLSQCVPGRWVPQFSKVYFLGPPGSPNTRPTVHVSFRRSRYGGIQ